MKYLTLLLLVIVGNLFCLQIHITDTHYNPIPYVILTSNDTLLTISDSLGLANFTPQTNTQQITFSRLGIKTITKTVSELHSTPTLQMQTTLIEADAINITTDASQTTLSTISHTQKVDLSTLHKTYSTTEDLLKDLPTIDIHGTNLTGERQTISLGGHQPRHTVIMLDGIVLNPSGQAVDLSSIPTSHIESIEIVRNNASTEAGSGGIGGVIILRTKRKGTNNFNYSVGYGSFDSVKQNMGLSLHTNNLTLALHTSQVYTKNNFEYKYRGETLKRENNTKDLFNINADLAWHSARQTLQYGVRHQKFYKQLPGPTNALLSYQGAYQQGSTTHNSLQYTLGWHNIQVETMGYFLHNRSLYSNMIAPRPRLAKDENKQTMTGAKATGTQNIAFEYIDLKYSIGGEYKKETFALNDLFLGRNSIPEIYRQITSGFGSASVQHNTRLWSPELVGSIRIDEITHINNHQSYRFEFNNTFHSPIPFKLLSNIGTSYMVPSFYDMYWIGDSQTQGNPDLLPEESIGWRIEAITETNPSLSVAKWVNKTTNLVYWYRSPWGWKPFNVASANIDNWECSGKYELYGQNIQVNYINTLAKNTTKGSAFYNKYITYTPPYRWNIDLNLRAGQFTQTLSYYAQGKQYHTQDQLLPAQIKAYELYNTRSGYEITSGSLTMRFDVSIYNVFNTTHANYDYMPEPGRHWEVGIAVRFTER